jgi:hypothetical protein
LLNAAASTAAAMLAGTAGLHQPCVDGDGDGNSHAAATIMLPTVFILGRCCMRWAHGLQHQAESSAETIQKHRLHPDVPYDIGDTMAPLLQWLQAGSTQEQLVAAGYRPQSLPQQLQQAVAAVQGILDVTSAGCRDPASWREAAQQLQAAGSALCSFAVPCLCNNPACSNLSGHTELGLVSGRSCVCGGCQVARYCGRACQRSAWKQHKPVCAALAAAAAAGAAAEPAAGASMSPAVGGV